MVKFILPRIRTDLQAFMQFIFQNKKYRKLTLQRTYFKYTANVAKLFQMLSNTAPFFLRDGHLTKQLRK